MKSIQEILESACENGCLELVKVCIKNGANIHNYSNWALRRSIIHNQYEVVKYLLESGANPYDYLWLREDAFWYAKKYKRTEIQTLLEQYRR